MSNDLAEDRSQPTTETLAPVLIIAFNRPDLLKSTLDFFLRSTRSIYISIDGPRDQNEKFLTDACIYQAEQFSKKSNSGNVKIRSFDKNQGCKNGVTNALDWAFKFEEYIIILEDDIKISQNFLSFCDLGLRYFKSDAKVFQLSGWTPVVPQLNPPIVYLTKFSHIWGWATWRDRWNLFDPDLAGWDYSNPSALPIFKDSNLTKNFDNFWKQNLLEVKTESTDIWDVQWLYSMWKHNCYSVSSGVQLCKNIGFDNRATHTKALPDEIFEFQRKSVLINPSEKFINWESAFRLIDTSFRWDIYHEKIAFNMDFYDFNKISDKKRRIIGQILLRLGIKKSAKKLFSWYLKKM